MTKKNQQQPVLSPMEQKNFFNWLKVNINMILAVLAALTASCLTVLCIVLYVLPTNVILEMNITCENPSSGQVFYFERNHGLSWEKAKWVQLPPLKKNIKKHVKLTLKVRKLRQVRICLETVGKIQIDGIRLKGKRTYDGKAIRVDFSEVQDVKFSAPGTFRVIADKPKAFFTLAAPNTIKGKLSNDYWLIGILAILCMMIFFPIFQKVLNLVYERPFNKLLCTLPLPAMVLLFAFYLSSRFDNRFFDFTEKRKLSSFPKFFTTDASFNTSFGLDFENFFKDHFRGRQRLIKYYGKMTSAVNSVFRNKGFNPNVIAGNDGFFFLCKDNSLRNYLNISSFSPKQLQDFAEILNDFDRFCRTHNTKFYYFIAPDKNRVYGEHLSFLKKYRPDSQNRTAIYVDYIRKNSNIRLIYPLETLKNNKKEGLVYYKTDTHWNHLGAYYGYSDLISEIKKDFPDLRVFTRKKDNYENFKVGDLYGLAPDLVTEENIKYIVPDIPPLFQRFFPDKHVTCHNPQGKRKLLLLRDSFGQHLTRYLLYSFAEVKINYTCIISDEHLEDIRNGKVDAVVLEHVERNILDTLFFF